MFLSPPCNLFLPLSLFPLVHFVANNHDGRAVTKLFAKKYQAIAEDALLFDSCHCASDRELTTASFPGCITLAKKIETTTRTWRRPVISRACTCLCLACVPGSIFLARVVAVCTAVHTFLIHSSCSFYEERRRPESLKRWGREEKTLDLDFKLRSLANENRCWRKLREYILHSLQQ